MRKFFRRVDAAVAWQPFTVRGLIALAFSLFLLIEYAFPESDLMAAMLGEALLILCAATALIALLIRFRLGRRLKAEPHFAASMLSASAGGAGPLPMGGAISQSAVPAGIVLTGSSVLSYFSLRLGRRFLRDGCVSPTHIVSGSEPKGAKRHLLDEVWFPHRGLWSLSGVSVELNDALGLTKFRWTLPQFTEVEVSAKTLGIQPLPIVAASSQSGDQLSQSKERSGDLFDIKAYDPSDGAKRILWKTYAKSRQVVVRRPEPAIVPEGEVAAYLVANPLDDHVAGAMQGYLQQLRTQNIVVLFGTDGFMADSPLVQTENLHQLAKDMETDSAKTAAARVAPPRLGSGQPQFFCSDPEDIQKAINRSVWSRLAGTGQGFESYMDDLANHAKQIHHVLVFAAEPPMKSKLSYSSLLGNPEAGWVDNIARVCAVYQAKLSIALVPTELSNMIAITSAPPIASVENFVATAAERWNRSRGTIRLNPAQQVRATIAKAGAELLEVEQHF